MHFFEFLRKIAKRRQSPSERNRRTLTVETLEERTLPSTTTSPPLPILPPGTGSTSQDPNAGSGSSGIVIDYGSASHADPSSGSGSGSIADNGSGSASDSGTGSVGDSGSGSVSESGSGSAGNSGSGTVSGSGSVGDNSSSGVSDSGTGSVGDSSSSGVSDSGTGSVGDSSSSGVSGTGSVGDSGAGSVSDSGTGSVGDSSSSGVSDSGTGSVGDSGSGSVSDSGSGSSSDSGSGNMSDSGSGSSSDSGAGSVSGSGSGSVCDSGSGSVSDSGSGSVGDSGSGSIGNSSSGSASDFLINNTGNGQVGVSWDAQAFSAILGPGQTIDLGTGVTDVEATLLTLDATYLISTNGFLASVSAQDGVAGVQLSVDTTKSLGQNFVGTGDIGTIAMPGSDSAGNSSSLNVNSRNDVGSITGTADGVGVLGGTLAFNNLTDSITGFDHINQITVAGWLGSVPTDAITDNHGIDVLQAT